MEPTSPAPVRDDKSAAPDPTKFYLGDLLKAVFRIPNRCASRPSSARQRAGKRRPSYPCCFKEDVDMRTFDFTPYYRATVGFDRLFDHAGQHRSLRLAALQHREDGRRPLPHHHGDRRLWPERNRTGAARRYASGLRPERRAEGHGRCFTRAFPSTSFKQSFNLADHVKVVAANVENGLLTIELVREVPEQLKPRRIEIGSGINRQSEQPSRSRSGRIPKPPDSRHCTH